jgi:hypothetical protein
MHNFVCIAVCYLTGMSLLGGLTCRHQAVRLAVHTQNEQELKAPARKLANRMIRFGKPDCLISSALVAVRGTAGSGEGILFPIKWRLTRKENKIHDNSRNCGDR